MINILVNRIVPALILCLSVNVMAVNTDIRSHEYKLLLNTNLFDGDESSRLTKVDAYWATLKNVIEKNDVKSNTTGSLSLDKNRMVAFYDVKGSCDLSHAGYSFRERIHENKREVTLKFLSGDEAVSKAKDLSAKKRKAKYKFEEDVSAPFVVVYSPSTTQKIAKEKQLNKMADPIALYPGLKSEGFDKNTPIEKVNNLTINEYVYKNASVDLGLLDAEFSLTLWYNESVSDRQVLVAEISFKYEDEKGRDNSVVAVRAKQLFSTMQEDPLLTIWNAADSLKKTATVYQFNDGFCDTNNVN
jgi:hypothetical protein